MTDTYRLEVAHDGFDDVLGDRRDSDRPDNPQQQPLPYRTVLQRNPERKYDPADDQVTRCERCGITGATLWRDWEDPQLPALCGGCHEELNTSVAREDLYECEAWCGTEDLDHSGLCRPR